MGRFFTYLREEFLCSGVKNCTFFALVLSFIARVQGWPKCNPLASAGSGKGTDEVIDSFSLSGTHFNKK